MIASEALRALRDAKEPPTCKCDSCANMCRLPCHPTPAETRRLILAGHAGRLALRPCWGRSRIEAIGPAATGRACENFLDPPEGSRCVFHAGGLCKLHGPLKPTEGRLAHHATGLDHEVYGFDVYEAIFDAWDSDEGRRLVRRWKVLVGYAG